MVLKVFTVYDSKAEAYLQPFCAQTKNTAIRAITDSVNNPKSEFHRWPADYTLFEIGVYDDQAGAYTMHEVKTNLGCLVEFVRESMIDPNQVEMALNSKSKQKPLKEINA